MGNAAGNKNVRRRDELVQNAAHFEEIPAPKQIKGLVFSMVYVERYAAAERTRLFENCESPLRLLTRN